MKPKIIATGISGLVGSRIVELLSSKFDFISFSLDTGVDITNFDLLKKNYEQTSGVTAILHLAAFTDVDAAFRQKDNKNGLCYRVNVLGTENVAHLAKDNNLYLISISTDFVFDGKKPDGQNYSEDSKPNPIEWYGETKYLSEKKIIEILPKGSIIRIAFPYKAKTANKNLEPIVKLDLVRKIISKLEKEEELFMFDDQIITPTFIDDIVKTIGIFIENKPSGIWHCVGSTSLSPYELAFNVASYFNFKINKITRTKLEDYLKKNPQARPRPKNLTLSNNKLKENFGFRPHTLEESLAIIKNQLLQ